MLIAKMKPNEAEDLKVQFTLQGLSQLGSQKYETIKILLPENKPLIIDETLTLVDSELWVATGHNNTILFNNFVYVHGIPEQDVLGLVGAYEIEDAGICYVNRFYYGEDYSDFVSSPLFEHVWVYTSQQPLEEDIYEYDE